MSIKIGANQIPLQSQGSSYSYRGFLGEILVYGEYNKGFNTFVGAVGGTITNETLLAAKLSLSATDIQDFTIDSNNNISCNIYVNYTMNVDAFYNNNTPGSAEQVITYYLDLGGKCTFINSGGFHNAFNPTTRKFIVFPNVTGCGTDVFDGGGAGTRNYWGIMCLPKMTPIGVSGTTSSGNFDAATFDRNVYVESSNQTINAGSPDPDIASAISSNIGTYIRYSSNTTRPDFPTQLRSTDIGTNYIDLEWDMVSHVNAIDYYVVFANGNVVGITSSTTITIGSLSTGTNYVFKMLAIDEHGNSSIFSDNVQITTL